MRFEYKFEYKFQKKIINSVRYKVQIERKEMSATPNVLKNPVFGWKAWHKTQWDGGDKSPDSIDFSKTSVSPSNISQAELLDTSKDTSVSFFLFYNSLTFTKDIIFHPAG